MSKTLKEKIAKMLAEAAANTVTGGKRGGRKIYNTKKKENVNNIRGAGAKAEPQKGHLKQVKGKVGKVMDEQKQKGLDNPKKGDFAKGQARGAKKAEKNMTPMQRLQREYEGLTRAAKVKEISKGKQSKYFSVIKKIGKGFASGGSGEGIDPKSIKSKGQFENLLSKGKLDHIPNPKLVDIAIRVGYISGKEMMGNAKGGAMMMMKKKGMAMGGMKKPAAGQTGLKKLPTPVRNKMGYMKKGGTMKKKGMAKGGMKKKGYAMGGMSVKYKVGGMVKGKSYGMVDNKKKK